MSAYNLFRDEVPWQPSLGDSEYPGVPNLGPAQTIATRIVQKTQDVAGDIMATETIWTFPEHETKPGDRLNGGEVVAVDAAKDAAGNVTYWIARVRR
jgi:hypothetical protein